MRYYEHPLKDSITAPLITYFVYFFAIHFCVFPIFLQHTVPCRKNWFNQRKTVVYLVVELVYLVLVVDGDGEDGGVRQQVPVSLVNLNQSINQSIIVSIQN